MKSRHIVLAAGALVLSSFSAFADANNTKPGEMKFTNNCGDQMSVYLYNQTDGLNAISTWDYTNLADGHTATVTKDLWTTDTDGSTWEYKVEVSGTCALDLTSVSIDGGGSASGSASNVLTWACDSGNGSTWIENLTYQSVVNMCQ